MNKSLALIPMAFAIFALMLSPAMMSVSASNGNGAGEKDNAQSCTKANDNSQARAQNPNCNDSSGGIDTDNDGLTDEEEAALGTDPNNPNTDGDRLQNGDELLDGDDACPLQPVTQYHDGEPDHDGDGTVDRRDRDPCPA